MSHPYETMPEDRFWRTAVAERDALEIQGLWKPKVQIRTRTRIVTAGSCFAQHFARALVARGYNWVDFEPGPGRLTPDQKHDYHYGTFSFRTGNIYTPRMLRQWLTWALGRGAPSDEVWERDGRFYDPFRPAIEPGGFVSVEELQASRRDTLEAIGRAVRGANVFVFTLGLTEAWQNAETKVEYAVCPGTIAGEFDPEKHVFVNHRFSTLFEDMKSVLKLMWRVNRRLNVLLTVSPVPLTATASANHVLTATSHSKSLLRAVASELTMTYKLADYFPSYEIITHPAYGGRFFAPNLRSVLPEGVDHVMSTFFRDQAAAFGLAEPDPPKIEPVRDETEDAELNEDQEDDNEADDLRCEEEILAAFAPDLRDV